MSPNKNSGSPFKLFEPYSARDKNVFFGRDEEIYALFNLLQQTQLVLMYGASGTGKTSLIHAGLPKVFKLSDWYCIGVRRKDNINDSLRTELARAANQTNITDLHQAINDIYKSSWIPIYLVFDQFEEVFTIGTNEERIEFFKNIEKLLDEQLPCKIIISMREEYIGHLYEYEHYVPTLFDKRFRVEPMNDETARRVVEQTCEAGGVKLEKGKTTAEHILQQVKEGKHAVHLPYLQVYLYYLYENAMETLGQPLFSEKIIAHVGKLGNVLKLFIEAQIEAAEKFFSEKLQLPLEYASMLLDQFATSEGTKKSHTIAELSRELNTPADKVRDTLNYFSEGKLLRADENEVERYEPVHDVVAKQIHELRTTEDKEFKNVLAQMENDYNRWQNKGRREDYLLPESDITKIHLYKDRLEHLEAYRNTWSNYVDESESYRIKLAHEKEAQLLKEQTLRHEAEDAKGVAEQQSLKAKQQTQKAYRYFVAVVLIGLIAAAVSGYSYINDRKNKAKILSELITAKQAQFDQKELMREDSQRKSKIFKAAKEEELENDENKNIVNLEESMEHYKSNIDSLKKEFTFIDRNPILKMFSIKNSKQ